jgi:hypothetical protein
MNRVSEQHRDAVGNQYCYREPGFRSDQGIAGWYRLGARSAHHGDFPAMHLLHPDQPTGGKTDTGGKPCPVGNDRLGSVTDVLT